MDWSRDLRSSGTKVKLVISSFTTGGKIVPHTKSRRHSCDLKLRFPKREKSYLPLPRFYLYVHESFLLCYNNAIADFLS